MTSVLLKKLLGGRLPLCVERLENRMVPAVVISVDALANQRPIDDRIYGENGVSANTISDLNLTVNRKGGNLDSRYNWQINAANHGSDFYFESISEGANVPSGSVDQFVNANKGAGSASSVTVPMIGWVAKLGANRSILPSFSVAKYGAQQDTDFFLPDAGNGVLLNGNFVTGNNPNDANVANSVAFQRGFVQHLVDTFGTASNGGVRYYTLDNEYSIWHQTHRDVHPDGASMDEVRNLMVSYSSMIKDVDPSAQVLGPEEFGWTGYFLSGKDIQYGDTFGYGGFLPDRNAHGGADNLAYLLDQVRQASDTAQKRLLDLFTVHFYPQAGEFSNNVSSSMQLLRNRSTRGLWDPNYVNESYIADAGPDDGKVQLVRRLQNLVDTYYPGTYTGITEYNWGAENHMNGATSQADVLGIFGREGLNLANRFPIDGFNPIGPTSPVYNAFRMFRNYDGQDHGFGNVSTYANSPAADDTSAFSAIRTSDGALTIMVVNKKLFNPGNPNATEQVTLNLSNFANTGVAELWQLAANNPNDQTVASITRRPDVAIAGNSLVVNVPMQSVSMFVIRPSATAKTTSTSLVASGNPSFVGSNLTFTATVNSQNGVPTGTVAFFDGTKLLATSPLNGAGQAVFSTSGLAMGTHSIEAVYQGNANFRPSNSLALGQSVLSQAANITTVDGTVNGDNIQVLPVAGQPNSVKVMINGVSAGTFTPTGPMRIRGLAGNDSITVDPAIANKQFILEGGDGNDTIVGGSASDTINGQLGNDLMFGAGGNDLIFGDEGADSIDGQDGSDSMDGGNGPDFMFGSGGNDLMFGSAGSDALDGGIGNDAVDGGADGDYLQASLGNDYLQGGGGDDSMDAGDGNDSMDGSDGNDVMFGLGGNDVLFGGLGNDSMDAGDGDDGVDAGAGDDLAFGSAGNDLIFGSSGNDAIDGNAGDDSMDGNDGNDLMFGSAGSDLMFGSAGNDSMDGGLGVDAADGGLGINLIFNVP